MQRSFFSKSVVLFALATGIVPGQSDETLNNVEHTNGSKAAVVLALANAAPSQLHKLIVSGWPPILATKEPVWRTNLDEEDVRQRLLRWDYRSYDTVFTQGFAPESKHQNAQDFNWDILQFAAGTYSPEEVPYVSTTLPYYSEGEFMHWTPQEPSQIEYLYEIFAPGGIDVNLTLGDLSPHPELREIIFPGGIRPEFVRSVRILRKTNAGFELDRIVVNPRFVGVDGLEYIRIPMGEVEIHQWEVIESWKVERNKNGFSATYALDPMKRPGAPQKEDFPDSLKSKRRIPDGLFRIAHAVKTNKVINTLPTDTLTEISAVITTDTGVQDFEFEYITQKKAYVIRAGSKVLMGASDVGEGSEVVLGELQNPELKRAYWIAEQQDSIEKDFAFYSYANASLVLKPASPTPLEGTKLRLGRRTGSGWLLKPSLRNLLSDGEYQICSSWGPNKVVFADRPTDTDPVQPAFLMENYRNDSQEYKFVYNNKVSAYSIQDVTDTRNYLVRSQNNSGVVKLKVDELAVGQYWKVENVDGKTYRLRTNGNSSEVLHLLGGHPTDEASIVVKQGISRFAKGQNWVFQRVLPDPVAKGTYEISDIEYPNQLVTCHKPVEGLTKKSTVDMSHNNNNATQKWNFQYYPAKRAYRISNLSDEKCVLVCDVNTEEVFGDYVAGDNSYWKIELTADGYYILRNAMDTSKSLYLPNEDVADGNNLICSRQGGDPLQLWRLHRRSAPFWSPDLYVVSNLNLAQLAWRRGTGKAVIMPWEDKDSFSWWVNYYAKHDAYTIHPKVEEETRMVYVGKDEPVSLERTSSDLDARAYWLVEYNTRHGGYVFRNLYNRDQAIDYKSSSEEIVTRAISYNEYQTWKISPGRK